MVEAIVIIIDLKASYYEYCLLNDGKLLVAPVFLDLDFSCHPILGMSCFFMAAQQVIECLQIFFLRFQRGDATMTANNSYPVSHIFLFLAWTPASHRSEEKRFDGAALILTACNKQSWEAQRSL